MRLTEKIIAALQNTFDTLLFLATMAVKEDFRNHVARAGAQDMNPSHRLAILGVVGREAQTYNIRRRQIGELYILW